VHSGYAISYRLASCFTESEVCVELKFIADRSSILGIIITLSGKLRVKKNRKNAPKITKNCAKIALFLYISVFILLKRLHIPVIYQIHNPQKF